MREIKFRGWVGDRMVIPSAIGEFGWYEKDRDFEEGRINTFDTLMQYTGKRDWFEGDVLKVVDAYGVYIGSIVWWEDRWALTYIAKDGVTPQFQSLMTVNNANVIGNVFRNPELLKT